MTSVGNARAASMSSLALINSLPVRPDDSTSLPQMPANSYRHANEPISLFLIVGGEGVLVHDHNWGVGCAARSRKVRKHLFDSSDELASFRVRSVWFRLDFDPTLLNHFSRASVGSEMCVAKELQAAAADSLHLRYSRCALSH